jgi:hypothetical protein
LPSLGGTEVSGARRGCRGRAAWPREEEGGDGKRKEEKKRKEGKERKGKRKEENGKKGKEGKKNRNIKEKK